VKFASSDGRPRAVCVIAIFLWLLIAHVLYILMKGILAPADMIAKLPVI
jgi:hypothetical protein